MGEAVTDHKAAIDQRVFRDVVGRFCTGIVVVTAVETAGEDAGKPCGFVAQSFVSLSLDPPLVGLCPARTSSTWPKIRDAQRYAINILGAGQKALCDRFARSGGDKFDGVAWRPGGNGAPLLDGVIAQVECTLDAEHDVGDHTFAVGYVSSLRVVEEATPLLFNGGGYGVFEAAPAS